MKIAFLLYSAIQNGGTKVLFRVGNLLQRRGHEVSYYVATPKVDLPFPSDCSFRFADSWYGNAIGRIRWLARQRIDAQVAVATFHPTALALHWNQSPVERKLYYVQAYEPEFYSDSMIHFARRWPMMLIAGASYLLPLERFVNCNGSKKGLSWNERRSVREIPPGIDLSLYKPRLHQNSELLIGHISRREVWKGSDHFFKAMVELRRRGWKFKVRVAYDHWRNRHGLSFESVMPVNERDLAEYYAGLDVLISTVVQKGFGYPPLEAMASGALCLATPMDYGRPGMDHLPIEANSTGSIVDVMERVFTMRDRTALTNEGLKTASAFDWDRIADQWDELLCENG